MFACEVAATSVSQNGGVVAVISIMMAVVLVVAILGVYLLDHVLLLG